VTAQRAIPNQIRLGSDRVWPESVASPGNSDNLTELRKRRTEVSAEFDFNLPSVIADFVVQLQQELLISTKRRRWRDIPICFASFS
jgi:hypothetical protein